MSIKGNCLITFVVTIHDELDSYITRCLNSIYNIVEDNNDYDFQLIIVIEGSESRFINHYVNLIKLAGDYPNLITRYYGNTELNRLGLSVVNGDFIIFISAFDSLDKDGLTELLSEFNEKSLNDYDLIKFNSSIVKFSHGTPSEDNSGIYLINTVSEVTGDIAHYPLRIHNYLYRVSFLRENNISYPNLDTSGDCEFLLHILSKSPNKVIAIPINVYNYFYNSIYSKDNPSVGELISKYIEVKNSIRYLNSIKCSRPRGRRSQLLEILYLVIRKSYDLSLISRFRFKVAKFLYKIITKFK
jgi:hypothetical protein